jgi:predicted DNA binding CopG/RHH family protein
MPPKLTGIFLNKSITFRISEADYSRLKNDVEIAGLSVSDLIRKRFYGKKL